MGIPVFDDSCIVLCQFGWGTKPECPLIKKCLSGYLVYNASVNWLDTNETKYYYGTCEKNFKERYNNRTASFRNKIKEKSIKLSKYI